MRKILVVMALSLAALASYGEISAETKDGLRVCQETNILSNGDFKLKALNRDYPFYWWPCDRQYLKFTREYDSCYSLEDGVLSMHSPAPGIWQRLDITPWIAASYELSFDAEVRSGSLECSVQPGLSTKTVLANDGFKRYAFRVESKITAEPCGGTVMFRMVGATAAVRLRDVVLKPTPPQNTVNAKEIYVKDAKGSCPLGGIVVSDGAAVEHFYDLKAAQYLQKYLYLSFGRVVTIYTGSPAAVAGKKGYVCFGKKFIPASVTAKIKEGGYAAEAHDGNVYVCGLDDGVIHGAFALLSRMGLEFFSQADHVLASDNVISLGGSTTVKNPCFAVRSIIAGSGAPRYHVTLGDSYQGSLLVCSPSFYYGFEMAHTFSALVDPALYSKQHPEYYRLKNGKRDVDGHRGRTQLCLSNPEVQRIASDTVLKFFALSGERYFKILQGDGGSAENWCQCDACKAYGATCSDRLLRFANAIARELKKKYPDKKLQVWAYCETMSAPVETRPEPNVEIALAVCGYGWGRNSTVGTRVLGASCVPGIVNYAAWLKTGAPIGCALYFPSLYEGVDQMRFFSGANAFICCYLNNAPTSTLTCYVMSKLAWDIEADVESHIDRFMNFFYGQGAPAMRRFLNLIEDKKAAFGRRDPAGHIGSDYIPLVVDAETLDKGLAFLSEAEPLVQRDYGKTMLKDWKRKLLDSYLLRQKSCLLRGEDLERFAKALAESLRTAREFEDNYWNIPRYRMSYREMAWVTSGIDLGEKEPWWKSPVVDDIIKDPLEMVKSKLRSSYGKTAKGLAFNMETVAGGKDSMNYQRQGVPKTKRPLAKILSRASSPNSLLSASFELAAVPAKGGVLRLEGLDDEKNSRARLKVLINGKTVFDGENRFGEDDWSWDDIPVPAAVLKQGANSLEITNTTPEKVDAIVDLNDAKDYTWGWLMVSAAELLFPDAPNPVADGKSQVFGASKKGAPLGKDGGVR